MESLILNNVIGLDRKPINIENKIPKSIKYKEKDYIVKYHEKKEKYYITVNDKIKWLNKDWRVCNKQAGSKSEVYSFKSVEDVKNILNYFLENKMWQCYLWFVIGINMARRAGDTRKLKWENFFHENGRFRIDILEIEEEKTDKLANPRINKAVKEAIEKYCDEIGINPMDEYTQYVFLNRKGTHKGKVFTVKQYGENLKKAAKSVGIEYNVRTHSTRKYFGMMTRQLHPSDHDSIQTLQRMLNHSTEKTTSNYIGLTKEKIDKYYDDMGEFFLDYIVGDKVFHVTKSNPIVSLDVNDLRDIIAIAYDEGKKNYSVTDSDIHINTINDIMKLIDNAVV